MRDKLNGLLFSMFLLAQVAFAEEAKLVASVEAEDGVMNGVNVSSEDSGYSGDGYVTGFDNNSDYLTVTVNMDSAALYEILIRYSGPNGDKTQLVSVNDEGASPIGFSATNQNEWREVSAGKYLLNQGSNTIKVQSSWGYTLVDKFSVFTTVPLSFNIAKDLVDGEANDKTVAMYDFIKSSFDVRVISGQTDSDYEKIANTVGYKPLLRSYDFDSFTQGYPYSWENGGHAFGAKDNGQVEGAISWYEETKGQGLVAFRWHWHSPTGGEPGNNNFYTENTDFDIREAVKVGTSENEDVIEDIDAIAIQLLRLQVAGVPVLWRPLHEAGGGWFWWGAKGSEACLALYDIVYDRLKNHHQIHNLIWVWSTPEVDWYPGNDKIDIVGYDSYPGVKNYTPQKAWFDVMHNITNGEKVIAMTENGPIPDMDETFTIQAPWAWFMSWAELTFEQNTTDHLIEIYEHWRVLVFDDEYNLIWRDDVEPTPPEPPVLSTKTTISDVKTSWLYPNPTNGHVSWDIEDFKKLEIRDLNGKMLMSIYPPADSMDVSHLKDGMYFIGLYYGKTKSKERLFIKH
ncbi:MAG: glycosyl hydrolase [Reichenbachiella sp.]